MIEVIIPIVTPGEDEPLLLVANEDDISFVADGKLDDFAPEGTVDELSPTCDEGLEVPEILPVADRLLIEGEDVV